MKIFTVENGQALDGVRVQTFTLKNGTNIPAVMVGESGRGRELGVLPVHLVSDTHKKWQESGVASIHFAAIGTTKSGTPKLYQALVPDVLDTCLVVARAHIGFRGSNSFTGDRINPADPKAGFQEFPGNIICQGKIAQGHAGNMGSGQQLVFVCPQKQVWRIGYGGRLYGAPAAHYFYFNGQNLECLTWEERCAAEVW